MSPRGRFLALLAALALVAVACGASGRVEREVAARRLQPAAQRGVDGPLAIDGGEVDGVAAAAAGPRATPGAGGVSSAGGANGGAARATTADPSGDVGGGERVAAAGGNGGATDIGVSGTSIKVGGVYFNGSYLDKYSQVSEQAASAYFKYVNDSGGVHGRSVEYVTCDTQGTVAGTQGCLRKLVEQDDVFIMGPSLDWNLDTVQGFLEERKLPWVGSSGLYPAEFASPWMFPTQMKGEHVGAMMATYAAGNLGAETVGISWLTNGAGPSCVERIRSLGPKLGYRVVVDASNGDTESDLTPQVIKVRNADPDVVLHCNDPVNSIKFMQASSRQGYQPPKGQFGGWVAADDVPQAIGPAAVGFHGIGIYDFYKSDTPGVKRFRQISKYYFPSTFHHGYTQGAYVGAMAIVEALQAAGPELTRQRFLDALRSMTDFDSTMGLRFNFADVNAMGPTAQILQVDENLEWKVVHERMAGAQ